MRGHWETPDHGEYGTPTFLDDEEFWATVRSGGDRARRRLLEILDGELAEIEDENQSDSPTFLDDEEFWATVRSGGDRARGRLLEILDGELAGTELDEGDWEMQRRWTQLVEASSGSNGRPADPGSAPAHASVGGADAPGPDPGSRLPAVWQPFYQVGHSEVVLASFGAGKSSMALRRWLSRRLSSLSVTGVGRVLGHLELSGPVRRLELCAPVASVKTPLFAQVSGISLKGPPTGGWRMGGAEDGYPEARNLERLIGIAGEPGLPPASIDPCLLLWIGGHSRVSKSELLGSWYERMVGSGWDIDPSDGGLYPGTEREDARLEATVFVAKIIVMHSDVGVIPLPESSPQHWIAAVSSTRPGSSALAVALGEVRLWTGCLTCCFGDELPTTGRLADDGICVLRAR